MDYKQANKLVYDTNAKEFERRTQEYIHTHILKDARLFVSLLEGEKVLDLGSGPGRDSVFLKNNGLAPLCFDISPEMIKLCNEKGLEGFIGDLENIPFPDASFHGVWAYTSLLHMPKDKLPQVLDKIDAILIPHGIFYLGMKEGNFEGWIENDKYQHSRRFFSLYTNDELRKAISPHFEIIHTSKVILGEATFLNYLCKKKSSSES